MSATIKSLQQAVVDEITQGFVANQCEFSAHDVTVCLRKKINDGVLELYGVAFEDVDGVNTQYVAHDDVRFIVRNHCGNGVCNVPGYERRWNPFTNGRPGGYFTWASLGSHADDDDDGTIAQPAAPVASVAPSQVQSTTGMLRSIIGHADPKDPVVIAKVVAYFTNRIKKGTPGTLHSAQRSLKRNPLFIAQIKEIALDNGFMVDHIPFKAECDSEVEFGPAVKPVQVLTPQMWLGCGKATK